MADQVDLANDRLQLAMERSVPTSYNFTLRFKDVEGNWQADEHVGRKYTCMEVLEEIHGVDLKHGDWYFGCIRKDGSYDIQASHPRYRTNMELLLQAERHRTRR